ncbi:GntR family transcriptional regulator [Streptomyces sp. H10-C2]|uniref:GntR family transcriptional regulator n=1 Tax=unclassified Streptomyces TaxID=2593676 RepID=UPI0024BBACD5|nr:MULTISPECIES: GntR family transcriptional regulator [unclassified Streptomyces]MDJ0340474.1 GntR family transcriptional regulator [Streptomyces sp. PH10-H1]MDJ0370119.1 GntR family transcriptional regulator [Streptomyces sp. H10-C2]
MPRWSDPRPAHQQIAAQLRDRIMAGRLEPGSKLPSTQQLMEEFSVVGTTVQKALQVLKAEGFAVGHPGKGVFVREQPNHTIVPASYMPPSERGAPDRWMEQAAARSRTGATRILDVAEVPAPRDVARALGLPDGGIAVLRSRLMLLDDEPAELVHSYYPVELARGTRLTDRRRVRGGSPTLLAELGYPPREFVDRVSARPPTTEEFTALELPAEVCVLRTFRVVYSDEARPIEVSVMVKAGHLYELEYRLSAT